MSILIDTMYQKLGLTAEEQSTVNAALPTVKSALDLIDSNLGLVSTALQLLTTNKKPLNQALSDWGVMGPNLASACVDGSVDLFGTLGAYNDIKNLIAANPKNMAAATSLYNSLMPVVNGLIADWPKISPAVQVLVTAAGRTDITVGDVAKHLVDG